MEEDVLNALQTRTAYLPGSFDRDGKIIFIVSLINELQSWQRKCLELSITYLKRSLSDVILQKGVTIIVDAQKTTTRINRHHARFIYNLFEGLTVNLYLVKSEGFWEKHVETCTKSQTKGEPIVLSRSRLMKYFDLTSLPEELGGQLQYNYDLWLQQRKSIDEFVKIYDNCLAAMESLQKLLQCNKSIRATEADAELKKNSQMHATVQCSIETVIEMGNRILTRFNEVYSLTPLVNNSKNHFNATAVKTNATTTAINDHDVHTPVATANGWIKRTLPPDLNCERARIEMRLNEIEKRQTDLRTAWLELIQTVREARELANLEEGVAFVTNWILNTAEQMLNRQTAIGCDVKACENLRSAHDKFELECRETYGFYAELLYKIESYIGSKDSPAYRDLLSQKEFMQFVCRSFATRLERRRNILITSLRFYRLVTEYFDKTTEVFESLVMGGSGGKMEDFTKASGTLQKLKSSQLSLASIERELIKEGEKLSDILSMPVKDALGRDLHIDYSDDICSVREILDTTLARRKIFSDSVELQKLTLEQVTHIYTYEQDACMAIKWLDDLYNVMIKCHSHVGCNIHEIQVQKDELQTFQETGKSIFNYGCQLLEASQTLRSTCKLEVTEALRMQQQLERTWHSLQAISQEHMTRLRVSAVFHRSVEDYCQQLIELRKCLRSMLQQQQAQLRQQQRSSSSGISSESEFQTQSPPSSAASTNVDQARAISRSMQQQQQQRQHLQQTQQHSSLVDAGDHNAEAAVASEKSLNEQRELLRKYLMEREKLLVEVGRMVRLGRLLKTRLKEPFVLDAATGKSIVVEDIPSEITTPSPTVDSTISGSSNTSTMDSVNQIQDPSKIVVNPIDNNGLACNAINNKLNDIAEVAESLDAVIRDVQENVQTVEVESNPSPSDKKLGTLRSTSSEDWHSRSTEDDSFATASEGNFTLHSSSSFQTASGRTSSFISCDKNSFDASEADDSTYAFEMPELTSPLNMSFEGSEQSYLSAQHLNNEQDKERTPTKLSESGSQNTHNQEDDQSSIADVEELHSESVTPTPEQHYDGYLVDSIPVESETELEVAGIVNAPSLDIITEHTLMPMSKTPEILDPYLDTKSSANAVEDILNGFSKQQIDVTTSLESWTTHIAEKREVETILEKIMSDNAETANKTTHVDTQLYPIFTSPSVDAKQLHATTQDKLKLVLQDIDQAQHEIQERVHTTLAIQTKDPESMQKIEQVISNLRTLKAKLDGIRYDYKTLVESVLQFLENVTKMRYEIDNYFLKQQQQYQQNSNDAIERCIAEHEKFRDMVMDKFRSLITQSELLIDRVRALEPPGAKEIDTDRILKLLENLRIYFESSNSERMSSLERLEKLEQFKNDIMDINRSLDSVCKQLQEINNQSVDSLAAAKTTSLAFEYFERTIESSMPKFLKPTKHEIRWGFYLQTMELLEKRIEKFTETTTQQLLISNPESESYVREELRKLSDKWQQFKDQVKNKRKSLDQATDFFEIIEKIDAEYHEISYFYNSVSNKITYLRDPVEASNLVNDIDRYVNEREAPLREKLDNAAKCSHDMGKVSQLYNDVMTIFQSFMKLKSDITIVQERLKHEERVKEQREKEAREQAERDKAAREAEARERAAREEEARLLALKEQAVREQIEREKMALELAARERAIREEEQRLMAAKEQAAREQAARELAAREAEEARLRALREEEARLQAAREQAQREQFAREQLAREEEQNRLKALREEESRLLALREQTIREEEQRLHQLREQNKREEEARQQAFKEQMKREEEARLQAVRDQIDHQRLVTENIRKDVQINHIFTEIKYSSPQFTKQLKDAVTRENDKFTFECEVTGNPEPTVEWFKDGISIQNNPDYKTSFNKGICRLVIEETFAADSARFTCRASNLVGNAETSANLSVRENAAEIQMIAPRIVRFLESGKAKEGSSYEFSCVVTGNPLPTVQWYKNDKCIDDSPDYVISYNNGEAKLRFEEVFLEDDAVYTCSASNPAGIEHCSASLIVEPLEPTEMPHFKIPLTNVMARVGQKIKLEALIGGIPRPDIYWLHNGKPFCPRDIKYEYGRVTVIIPQAYPKDAGVYVLTAKNLAGEAYSSCNVNVKGRLPNETSDSEMASDMDVEPIKPSVQLALKDVSIFEGKPVRLDCVIVGQPEPEVIWYHNDRPVKESADVQLLFQGDKCSLIIQEVYQEDGGNYKVVAINSAGEASSSCELKVTPLNIAEPATRAQSERQSLAKELEPKFEKFLSDVLVDEGETVEMEVMTSGDKPMTAKWFLTNKELTNTDRFLIESNPNGGVFKLTIKNVNNDDKGVYTVKVCNSAGEAKCFSHLIVKSVNAPESQRTQQVEIVEQKTCPEFKELFSDKTANLEDLVKFECIVKGKPTPKVHWYFNDQPVHGHNFLVSTSGEREVLTIQKVGPDTVGKVSCVAENDVGKATCVAFLGLVGSGLECMPAQSNMQTMTQEHNTDSSRVTIKKQTYTTTSTSQVSSYEGNMPQTEIHHSSAHIDQSLKQLGAQRPEIMESHHYQELHKSKDMSSPHVQQKSFVLVQSAANGSTTTNAIVPSSPTRTRREIAPRFTTPLTGKIVDQGADVSMEAIYDGFPSPEIKVEKNGAQLFDTDRLKIGNKCNRVTIDLKEVNVGDAGRYAVTASNTMGQSTSTADLVVKKTIFPPVFGRRLQAQVVKKGEKIIMEVEVTGLPEPTVVWMKDEKPLNESGLSQHRLLTQGNTHKLIIEKGQVSDSGKYMVKATNAGGEAKSIADCAVLEPTPERMQEVVKTIVYETPSEFKSETLAKEPQSFETQQSDITTSNDLHGLSESKIITEHRCTTEATMRLEHKSAYLDLPELQQRTNNNNENNTTTTSTTVPTHNEIKPIPTTIATSSNHYTTTNIPINQDVTDFSHQLEQLKSLSSNFENMQTKIGYTQTPPPVPPKPYPPVTATIVPPTNESYNTSSMTSTSTSSEKKSSSFEYFKKIDEVIKEQPKEEQKFVNNKPLKVETKKSSFNLEEELKNLNLIPGSPPEICFTADGTKANKPSLNEKIQKLEERQLSGKEPPHGGISIFPPQTPTKAANAAPTFASNMPLASETYSHDTTLTKSVKVEYGQPIMRPAATLPTPAQQFTRSPSPKPSAEGLAMSKLWTPNHVSGYESCTSELEQYNDTKSQKHEVKEIKIQKLPTPTQELSAPFLVKQVTQSIPIPQAPRSKTPIDGVELKPGTPPEICFAGQPEQRRQSLVETMERTLEQNLIQGGPSRVLPHSVPTITPQSTKAPYKPPPPVVPPKLQTPRGEYYESDYESDRWKYSGSESDENSLRPALKPHQGAFKTNGYAADTEEISSFSKMESSMMEKKSYYESSSTSNATGPGLEKQPPAQLYFSSSNASHHNGPDKQESFASQENKYHHEDKDYKVTSMTKNIAYNMSSSSTTGPKFQSTPIKAPVAPSPIPVQRKTPAEFSDYSSEIDERFRSVSRNCESESEIKGYRVVFPPTPVPKTNGHKSPVVVVTPSPMEFESAKPKFEPIRQEQTRHEVKTETSKQFYSSKQQQQQQQQQTQQVFKPKPVAAKFLAAAQQQQTPTPPQPQFRPQPQHQQPAPSAQPTMYYNAIAGTPLHMAKMATETKNVMQMKESSETCQRVVNMQQTKRVIHFDSQKEESSSHMHSYGQQPQQQQPTQLEPFPYSPTPSPRCTPARQRVPPPPTPTKFVPGDFRESDYDSEIENAKIAPLWTPMGEQGPLRFRHVEPPRPGRSCSLPRSYERVLSPMEFDRGPEMPSKIQVDVNALRQQRGSSVNPRTQSLSRHSSMRSNQQNYQSTLYEQEQQQNFSRDDMNLKVGSPPRYGYIQSQAEEQAKTMSSTFMQKSHKFVEDVQEDLHKMSKTTIVNGSSTEPRVITHSFRPGFKRAPSEGDNKPQAYRDESRVSQYGTKCVDPNTGLIYFKYDFGYEFGILFPGEGHKFVANKWNSSQSSLPPTTSQQFKQTGRKSPYPLPGGRDLVIPVRHERSTTSTPTPLYSSQSGSGGYYSDTETTKHTRGPSYKMTSSNVPSSSSFAINRLKKRYSLPNTQVIDVNIDRLHSNGSLHNLHRLPYPADLPQDVPVNAHLNRDEYPQKPPMFITPLKDRAVVAGQQARFECIVQCHPQPQIMWTKNGYDLESSNKHILEYRNGVCRLTIPQAYPDDAGTYSCSATNPLGTATTTGSLEVTGKYNAGQRF
ncbi:uncharacterized protein LOC111679299 isoform X8 [Lucilia cuprina]|uniref:uncharacterized protein LOC111679299 isoform X8 n=1 Tax=Lucilia cuprina TaxID=7375 RepID=UPI001F0585B4|nr:uncharacterized protein LOC111679299 isoform X8 [Lucilia cuprina]